MGAEVLRPAEAARRLGVRTLVVIEAMYEKRVPQVRLPDGTLGIPADSLHLIGGHAVYAARVESGAERRLAEWRSGA